jgi:hypothetical protein
LSPSIAAAQARVPFEHGTHAFRFVLNNLELTPLTDLSQLDEDSIPNSILIVFGETQALDSIPGGLKSFLDKGGALLVATDRAGLTKWQELLQISFRKYYVRSPAELAYKNNEECPFVVPTQVQDPPIFRNLNQVATNRPTYFINRSQGLKTLAVFDRRCWVEGPLRLPANYPFAAGGEFGEGRVLVLSDHSVFINEMMIQTDNDNFDFAYNCVDWLRRDRGDGQPKRTHVLFLDEGETVANFDVPVTDVPVPSMEVINRMLVKMQQENLFNRIILGEHPDERLRDILRVLIVVFTTALAGFGCYRFLQARYGVEAKEPLFSAKVAQETPDIALTIQRQLAMIKADNFWEAAHHLARDWFLVNVPDLFPAPGKASRRRSILERFSVDSGWWRRRSLEKKVQAIWDVAAGPPRRLSASDFARFVTQFEEIKTALARGALRLKSTAD